MIPSEEERAPSGAEVRRAILTATEQLLVEEGYAGFSMRQLALRCGYSAPTIYHHFGDKKGVIDALLEERFSQLVDELRAVPLGDDPVENVRALSLAFTRFGIRNPTHYQLLMQPRDGAAPPPASGEIARLIMQGPLDELARDGRLAADDHELARQGIWAQLHGLISLRAVRPEHDWREGLLEQSVDAMLRGWLTTPDAGGRDHG
jgi:AcrR family transcriptional regulator